MRGNNKNKAVNRFFFFAIVGLIVFFFLTWLLMDKLLKIEQPHAWAATITVFGTLILWFVKEKMEVLKTEETPAKQPNLPSSLEENEKCTTPCRKGVNYYEKRNKTGLIEQLENITLHSEITILTIHLTPINELFQESKIKDSMFTNKPKITIYALNTGTKDSVLNELYHLYKHYENSEDLKNGLINAHNYYKENIKPLYDANDVTINLKFLNIDEENIPIPPFQWYEVNKFVYFNPLVTLYIHDTNLTHIDELDDKKTPRDGLYMVFNSENLDAQKLLTDYRKTLKYYETHCLNT